MTQFVRHQRLQFSAFQLAQRPLRHGNNRILGNQPGRKGIDRPMARQQHDHRHGHLSRERHFFHNFLKVFLIVMQIRLQQTGSGTRCKNLPALRQQTAFDPPATQHEQQRNSRVNGIKILRQPHGRVQTGRQQPENQPQRAIDCQHQQDKGQGKCQNQAQAGSASGMLLFKKCHRTASATRMPRLTQSRKRRPEHPPINAHPDSPAHSHAPHHWTCFATWPVSESRTGWRPDCLETIGPMY